MLAIKLKRIGKKHQSAFRIVVAEKRSKMGGKSVEDLGFWNPREKKASVNKDRALHWIKSGAQATDTVHNIFVKEQVIDAPKKSVHDKKGEKAAVAEKAKAAEEAKAKAQAEVEAKKAAEEAKAQEEAEKAAAESAAEISTDEASSEETSSEEETPTEEPATE